MNEVIEYCGKFIEEAHYEWAKSQTDLAEAWRVCPNVLWMNKFHNINQDATLKAWRLATCDSIRSEIWEYLFVNEEGIIGGHSNIAKENFSLGDNPSKFSYPATAKHLVVAIEKFCLPHLRKHISLHKYEEMDFRIDIVNKFETWRLFCVPYWNAYTMSCNACQTAGAYYFNLNAFQYIQCAVGLMTVMNTEGLTPRANEEFDPRRNQLYQSAVQACALRQADMARTRFCNPFLYRAKKQ